MIKNILYTTDFSEVAENALPHAQTLSLLFDAKLILFNGQILHQDDPSNPLFSFPEKETLYKKAEEIAKGFLKEKGDKIKDIEFEKITRRDFTADRAILSICEEKKLKEIEKEYKPEKSRIIEGKVEKEILKFAREEAIDLLFLGDRSNADEEFFAFGAKAERIIIHSPSPCIIFKG